MTKNGLSTIEAALERILASSQFERTERMSSFLRLIVTAALQDPPAQPTEREIGIEVFGRAADWNPKIDPIVRVEARRLRSKLEAYYAESGSQDPVRISVPKGGYTPHFDTMTEPLKDLAAATAEPVPRAGQPKTKAWKGSRLSLALGGLAIAVLLGWLFVSAVRDQSVVIGHFVVPPAFEAEGRTSAVIASQLLDALRNLQNGTRAWTARRAVKDAWSNEIQLQTAPAGTAIGVLAWLRDTLGSHLQIAGSVVLNPDGTVSLSVRGNGFASKTFTGASRTLPQLVTQAAEYIYGEAEPGGYPVYLIDQGRYQEACDFIARRIEQASKQDRAQMLHSWGTALSYLGDLQGALEKFQALIREKPDSWGTYSSLIGLYERMGNEEGAYQTGRVLEAAAHRGSWIYEHLPSWLFRPVQPYAYMQIDNMRCDWNAVYDAVRRDMERSRGQGTTTMQLGPVAAEMLINLHDLRGARLQIETTQDSATDPYVITHNLVNRISIASMEDDTARMNTLLQELNRLVDKPSLRQDFGKWDYCWMALTYEKGGQPEEADRILRGRSGLFASNDCTLATASIAANRGNWEAAQAGFRAAVEHAPSMPVAYETWGRALLKQQQYDAALSKFQAAAERGPHWAEPLEGWGEALLAKGSGLEAAAKFEQASRFAPQWGGLYLQWGLALQKAGQKERAKARFEQAAGLDLSLREKAQLAKL